MPLMTPRQLAENTASTEAGVLTEAPSQVPAQAPAESPAFNAPVQTSEASSAMSFSPEQFAAQGYEGFKLDWSSFPQISLKIEGFFEDYETNNFGKEFQGYVLKTKPRWCYRAERFNPQTNKKEGKTYFTYDRKTIDSGDSLTELLDADRANGYQVSFDEYIEVFCQLHMPGSALDGEYRTLSVSPSSKGRFWGNFVKANVEGKGDVASVLWQFSVGAKITGVANPYYPWAFSIVKEQ